MSFRVPSVALRAHACPIAQEISRRVIHRSLTANRRQTIGAGVVVHRRARIHASRRAARIARHVPVLVVSVIPIVVRRTRPGGYGGVQTVHSVVAERGSVAQVRVGIIISHHVAVVFGAAGRRVGKSHATGRVQSHGIIIVHLAGVRVLRI